MRLGSSRLLGAVLCFFSMTACDRLGPSSAGENPPANSYHVDDFALVSDSVSQTVRGASVTPAFLAAVKTRPLLGRLFLPEEHRVGGAQVAVVGNRLWQRTFGADPRLIGKTLVLNGRGITIVGIMPSGFEVPSGVDLWVPTPEPAH